MKGTLNSHYAKIAFILIVLSFFFPWFTMSMSTYSEDDDYYLRTTGKEYYGPDKFTQSTKVEWEEKNDKDYTTSKLVIPIDSELISIDSEGTLFESPMIMSLMILKQKLLVSILIISLALANSVYGNIEITKRLFELATILMVITVAGFLINVKGDYIAQNYDGQILASTNDDDDDDGKNTDENGLPEEKIVMRLPIGYSTINDENGGNVNGQTVDKEITSRWHPSIGFILATIGTILLVNTIVYEFKKTHEAEIAIQEYNTEELQKNISDDESGNNDWIEEK